MHNGLLHCRTRSSVKFCTAPQGSNFCTLICSTKWSWTPIFLSRSNNWWTPFTGLNRNRSGYLPRGFNKFCFEGKWKLQVRCFSLNYSSCTFSVKRLFSSSSSSSIEHLDKYSPRRMSMPLYPDIYIYIYIYIFDTSRNSIRFILNYFVLFNVKRNSFFVMQIHRYMYTVFE